jgi:hypothetical protein
MDQRVVNPRSSSCWSTRHGDDSSSLPPSMRPGSAREGLHGSGTGPTSFAISTRERASPPTMKALPFN